jgi:hypothetical protein
MFYNDALAAGYSINVANREVLAGSK